MTAVEGDGDPPVKRDRGTVDGAALPLVIKLYASQHDFLQYREFVTPPRGQKKPKVDIKECMKMRGLVKDMYEKVGMNHTQAAMKTAFSIIAADPPKSWTVDLNVEQQEEYAEKMALRLRAMLRDIGQAQIKNPHTPWVMGIFAPSAFEVVMRRPAVATEAKPSSAAPKAKEWFIDFDEKTRTAYRQSADREGGSRRHHSGGQTASRRRS